MAKNLVEFKLNRFSTGLNVVDSSIDIQDSDLIVADNVTYLPTGEVVSVDAPLQVANDIRVNLILSTKVLGSIKFNGNIYIMASNDSVARLLILGTKNGGITSQIDNGGGGITITSNSHAIFDGDSIRISGTANYNGIFSVFNVTTNTFDIAISFVSDEGIGSWVGDFFLETTATNFNSDAFVEFEVYKDKIWFVNGEVDNGNVLHFLDKFNVLTGLNTGSGLAQGINRIVLHLERLWISKDDTIFVSRQFPNGSDFDWDSATYTGSFAAGLLDIDVDDDDKTVKLITQFGQLVVFRQKSIHVVVGKIILTSTIQKSFNATGVSAFRSISLADRNIYFLSESGVQLFSGISVQEGTTQFDSVSTNPIDRRIRPLIRSAAGAGSGLGSFTGYSFEDKYYLSDANNFIFIFDEITGGWSRLVGTGAEVFIDDGENLFYAKGSKFFKAFGDVNGSVESEIRTKNFNLGTEVFHKVFHKLITTFLTFETSHDFDLSIFIDGASGAVSVNNISIIGSALLWNSGVQWNTPGLKWNSESIDYIFNNQNKSKFNSGVTVSIGLKASGKNRFNLNSIDLLSEQVKRGN